MKTKNHKKNCRRELVGTLKICPACGLPGPHFYKVGGFLCKTNPKLLEQLKQQDDEKRRNQPSAL